MRYFGGKLRHRDQIGKLLTELADVLSSPIEDRCCGSLAVTRGVFEAGGRVSVAIDANVALMCLYRSVRDGWIPPRTLSREEFIAIQRGPLPDDDPMTAFAMIFCSYGGKWGSGYLPDDDRWPGDTARHAATKAHVDLLRMKPWLERIDLRCGDCRVGLPKSPTVIYFDPPYVGVEGYARVAPFPHASFLQCVTAASAKHAIIVSEFTMPPDWREIAAMQYKGGSGFTKNKVERLFVLRGGLADRILLEREHARSSL